MNDKNNKPLESIEQLERENVQKSLLDIPEGLKSKEEMTAREKTIRLDLINKLINERIQDIKIVREERKKYANKTFQFLWRYISTVIVIMVVGSLDAVRYDKDFLESIPLVILIGTIPAAMALFGWVLKGLFPIDQNK